MPWLAWVVSNVLLALLLALAAWFVQRWLRRPAVAHVLWVLVLVKLVTPPLVSVPLGQSPGTMACTLGHLRLRSPLAYADLRARHVALDSAGRLVGGRRHDGLDRVAPLDVGFDD